MFCMVIGFILDTGYTILYPSIVHRASLSTYQEIDCNQNISASLLLVMTDICLFSGTVNITTSAPVETMVIALTVTAAVTLAAVATVTVAHATAAAAAAVTRRTRAVIVVLMDRSTPTSPALSAASRTVR